MEAFIKFGGWGLAAVLLLVSGYLYTAFQQAQTNRPLTDSVPAEADTATGVDETSSRALQAALDAARQEAEALRRELADLKLAQARESAGDPLPPGAAEALAPEPSDATDPDVDPESVRAAEKLAQVQMGVLADMAYQGLFEELALEPEVRDAVKAAIVANLAASQKVTNEAFVGRDQQAREVHAKIEALDAALRDELAQTLTPEELAVWDDYEPVADQILYERVVESQLITMAGGLTDENRVLTSQVIAEELVREFDLLNQSQQLYTQETYNGAQARALNASLARLDGAIEAEQYEQVQQYVNQAFAAFEAMASPGTGPD